MNVNFFIPVEIEHRGLIHNQSKEEIGIIEISATATLPAPGEDPELDYGYIKYNGTNILPLLDNIPAADDLLQYFYTETLDRARQQHLKKVSYEH